jgi:hypothetical protein
MKRLDLIKQAVLNVQGFIIAGGSNDDTDLDDIEKELVKVSDQEYTDQYELDRFVMLDFN